MERQALSRLVTLAGILPSYRDAWGKEKIVSVSTQRALLQAMGFDIDQPEQITDHIRHLEEAPYSQPLPPVIIVKQGQDTAAHIPIALAAGWSRKIQWRLELETGACHDGELIFADLPLLDHRLIDGAIVERRSLTLSLPLNLGHHRFSLFLDDGDIATRLTVIVVPSHCYRPPPKDEDDRQWGLAAQLYALKSERNWGIGDFSDLVALVRVSAGLGAAAVGLNPLHALFPADPSHISPYSPSHRQFLSILYLDVEAIPDFAECAAAQRLVQDAGTQAALAELRAKPLIDYERVAALKLPLLQRLYQSFRELHLDKLHQEKETARAADFRRFQRVKGESLEQLGLFQALSEHFSPNLAWPDWPPPYHDPQSPETARFAEAHRDRVEYFHYLQWQAAAQLASASAVAQRTGMAIGLYHDLALAPDYIGAEVWANRRLFATGVRLGAPPDDWNLKGQNWGVMPYNPHSLRQAAYQPFAAVLGAAMADAGALRIDHVMGLERLYWIPEGADAEDGGYVRYPVDDLLAVLALESQRRKCVVIGEDLGTLPEGFQARLQAAEILSYRLLYFSQDDSGVFLPPADYPATAAVAVSTHDLAPLAGYWRGRDLELRAELDLYPSPAVQAAVLQRRARDRRELIAALKRQGLLPPDYSEDGAEFSFELVLAVYRYLARTPARLLFLSLEDVLGEENQINMPGTVSEHPNWRRTMASSLDELERNPSLAAIAAILKKERGAGSLST